jgi:hypothetical protein
VTGLELVHPSLTVRHADIRITVLNRKVNQIICAFVRDWLIFETKVSDEPANGRM